MSVRETTSRAEPMYFAICSCVSVTVSLPVLAVSSARKMASRLSILMNRICCMTHITSEKRLTDVSRAKILICGLRSETAENACPFMVYHSLFSSASTKTSNVTDFKTHEAESIHISPPCRR